MPNIQDIAKATGYSATTVSKAFNNYSDISDKAKKIILQAAKEMGYIPNAQARGLKMKRSFTIGVILDELLGYGLSHPFFSMLIQAFREAVEDSGYSMILITNELGGSGVDSYTSHCQQRDVDGVFILCTDPNDPGIQELIQSDIPTVLFDMPHESTSCVMSDHYQGAYDAVKYLAGKGHTKLAHIYGSRLTYAGDERYKGFIDGAGDLGIEIVDDYLVSGGYFDLKYGKMAMEELMSLPEPPTAVFASGDMMALGAMQVCAERGIRIPEDVSIIGFDNLLMLEWIKPSLTTIGQDYESIGKACCQMLEDIIGNKNKEITSEVIHTQIIERDSCLDMKDRVLSPE